MFGLSVSTIDAYYRTPVRSLALCKRFREPVREVFAGFQHVDTLERGDTCMYVWLQINDDPHMIVLDGKFGQLPSLIWLHPRPTKHPAYILRRQSQVSFVCPNGLVASVKTRHSLSSRQSVLLTK